MNASNSFVGRGRQAWTIARIELRRAFFAKRSLWVYVLALLPSVIFFGHGLDAKLRSDRLAQHGVISPALMDSVREGETAEDVKKRLGKPAEEDSSTQTRRVRQRAANAGTTTHIIEPTVDARFVRLNISRPSYSGEPVARIYEFEVYGPEGKAEPRAQSPRHRQSAVQPGSGAGKSRERQRVGRPDRSVVRSRGALVPAGGSGCDSPGDALRRASTPVREAKSRSPTPATSTSR